METWWGFGNLVGFWKPDGVLETRWGFGNLVGFWKSGGILETWWGFGNLENLPLKFLHPIILISMKKLDSDYWNNRYLENTTGWDLGEASPPLKVYIDQLKNKSIRILIPGCGNCYEALYLLEKGFSDITVIDIAPALTASLQKKLPSDIYPNLKIITGDFFSLEDQFDLVLEQTFFCALDPSLREAYAKKMHSILKPGGKIAGVLFNREFEGGPPFGGNEKEYRILFGKYFQLNILAQSYNSIEARIGSEVFIEFEKNL